MLTHLRHRLHRRHKGERYGFLEELLANQRLDRRQLLAKQQRELSALVDFAVNNTDFYRRSHARALQQGAGADLVQGLPVLHKRDVVLHREEMVARGLDKARLRIGHTGGSTGRPLSFYYDSHKIELMRAGMMRGYMWSGWRPGEKILNFWGARQDLKAAGRFWHGLKEFIAAENTVGAYDYSGEQLRDWARLVQSYRPVLLQGYASILAELAAHVLDRRLQMPPTLKGVYSTAEVLYDWQRRAIEQAFACRVFNQYGSREVPNIALECRHGSMHVFTDMVYLESLQLEQEQRLLVTSLTNRVMPFIRYAIGDSGSLEEGECPCGSPFPLMKMGVCRSNDIITTPGGRHVYPSYFIHLLDGVAGIERFQFVQEELNCISLVLQSSAKTPRGLQASLQRRLHSDIDSRMRLQVRRVDEIQRSVSGKHRFVISRVRE